MCYAISTGLFLFRLTSVFVFVCLFCQISQNMKDIYKFIKERLGTQQNYPISVLGPMRQEYIDLGC